MQLSAKEGDASAKEVLRVAAENAAAGVPEKVECHWNVLYHALNDIVVDKANGELCVPQETLLNYNADVANFGAAHLLCQLALAAPGVFRCIQGGGAWAPKEREKKSALLVTAVSSVQALIATLDRLHVKAARISLVDETIKASRAHQEELLAAALRDKELEPADEDAARTRNELNLKTAAHRWRRTLQAAAAALKLDACPGRVKLNEAVDVLAQQQLFNINVQPVPLPETDEGFVKLFALPSPLRTFSKLMALRTQWGAHRASWTAPAGAPAGAPAHAVRKKRKRAEEGEADAAPVLSQRGVWDYWAALAESAPELSRLALRSWLSPLSSASVERIFSYLTHLDTPDRRSMERSTLEMILFLRANWRIVELLRLDLADAFEAAEGPADRVGEAAAGVATAAAVAMRSARAAAEAEAALFEEAAGSAAAADSEGGEGDDADVDVVEDDE